MIFQRGGGREEIEGEGEHSTPFSWLLQVQVPLLGVEKLTWTRSSANAKSSPLSGRWS